MIPPIVLAEQCTNMTTIEKEEIDQKCESAIAKLNKIIEKISSMDQDARIR